MVLHPATLLFLWAVVATHLTGRGLLIDAVITGLVLFLAGIRAPDSLVVMLLRIRWLLLAALVSFSLSTPGQTISSVPLLTYEGVYQGFLQCVALVGLVSMVVVLIDALDRDELVIGLYVLARPFAMLGFDRRQFAVRLSLTLNEMRKSSAQHMQTDAAPHKDAAPWSLIAALRQATLSAGGDAANCRLAERQFGIVDMATSCLGLAILVCAHGGLSVGS